MGIAAIGIIAALVGIGIGYATWGSQARALEDELARSRVQVREVAGREGAAATRLQEVEARVKQVAEQLAGEKELREKLDALAATKKR